jgi:PilZ domain
MERRRDARFEVELKCRVQPGNGLRVAEGTTISMSRSGALIEISATCSPESVPQPGEALSTEVRLPLNIHFGPRCLSCKGVAVRTFKNGKGYVVAVCFKRIKFGAVAAAAAAARTVVM